MMDVLRVLLFIVSLYVVGILVFRLIMRDLSHSSIFENRSAHYGGLRFKLFSISDCSVYGFSSNPVFNLCSSDFHKEKLFILPEENKD